MKLKGRALRRALETTDAVTRIGGPKDVPLIQDKLELITPEYANEMLLKNTRNRPINWREVEKLAEKMRAGNWVAHGQGIMLAANGDILTGQHRLWAVIYANCSVHMMVSRGNPPEAARVIDRGRVQSARDLASRETGRKHTPTEASIARAALALCGVTDPTTDEIATLLETASEQLAEMLTKTKHIKKTRAVVMVLAALVDAPAHIRGDALGRVEGLATALTDALAPYSPEKLWNKGAAFGLAMRRTREVVGYPNQ